MDYSMPVFSVLHQLLESAQTHVHRVNVAIQPSHPLLPPSPLAPDLAQRQGFSSELAVHIRWPKYGSFNFSPSNEYSGLISAPQFESISYSAFSLLYGPTLTSVHDYWKNHSFDCSDLC